jgi:hypothetical protein
MVSNDGGAHDVFIVIGATLPNYHDITIVMVRSQTLDMVCFHLDTQDADEDQVTEPLVPLPFPA